MICGMPATQFLRWAFAIGALSGYLVAGMLLFVLSVLWRGPFDPDSVRRHAGRDDLLLTILFRGVLAGQCCLLLLLFSLLLG